MREALFRAAQQGAYFTDEDTVGRWQDAELTSRVLTGSLMPVPPAKADPPAGAPLIVWPYPRGTVNIFDRANCADHFLRANPEFQLITESTMDVSVPAGPVLLFTPFDTILSRIRTDSRGYLTLAGRRITALHNELSLAHLVRHGVLATDSVSVGGYRPIVPPPRTHLVNGTQLTLFKARQLRHVADLADRLAPLGVAPLPYACSATRAEAVAAVVALGASGNAVVVRPFGASQGTGVVVIGPSAKASEVEAALSRVDGAITGKYGAAGAYPVTITPFVESRKIDGAVSDVRMFVVYDAEAGGLRALPGMVRRAARPFRADNLTATSVLTNFSGAAAADGDLPGPRLLPTTRSDVLDRLGLSPDALVDLGRAASILWACAVASEAADRDAPVPFSYGSVDFLIRQSDGRAVPIEMNGANVGEHPTVAVRRHELFAEATTAALTGLGLSTVEPAWSR